MKNDEYFMKEAIKEAEIALANGDWPIGSIVVLEDEIIARGHNQVYSKPSKLAHAELLTLEKVQNILIKNRQKCTLYTTCEPCPMCFGAAILSKIKRLVYGIKENSGGTHLQKHLPVTLKREPFKIEITGGILADTCWEVFIKGKPTQKLIDGSLILTDYK